MTDAATGDRRPGDSAGTDRGEPQARALALSQPAARGHDDAPDGDIGAHGPPGVGKTETGLILAEALLGSRDAVRRIDCAEFQADHDTARLTAHRRVTSAMRTVASSATRCRRVPPRTVLDEFDRGPPRSGSRCCSGSSTPAASPTAAAAPRPSRTPCSSSPPTPAPTRASAASPISSRHRHRGSSSAATTRLEETVKSRWLSAPEEEGGLPTMSGLGSPALWSRSKPPGRLRHPPPRSLRRDHRQRLPAPGDQPRRRVRPAARLCRARLRRHRLQRAARGMDGTPDQSVDPAVHRDAGARGAAKDRGRGAAGTEIRFTPGMGGLATIQ